MTTAHRPTWKAAFGLADNINKGYTPTRSYSARVIFIVILGHARVFEVKVTTMGSGISRLIERKGFQVLIIEKIAISKIEKDWRYLNR